MATCPAAFGATVAVIVYVTVESPVITIVSVMSLDPDAVFPLALPVPVTLDVYDQLVNALIVAPLASVVFWSASISFTTTVDFPPVFFSVIVNVTVPPGVYVVTGVILLDVTVPTAGVIVLEGTLAIVPFFVTSAALITFPAAAVFTIAVIV